MDDRDRYICIPIINDEGREKAYERSENLGKVIHSTVLNQLVECVRFKTLGDALDANPITVAAMAYMIDTLEECSEHILSENGLIRKVDDSDSYVWVEPDDPNAPYGIKVAASFEHPDAFDQYMVQLPPERQHAIAKDIKLWSETSEMYATLTAICDRLRIAMHDAIGATESQ